jgi:hypothetical protein
MGAPCSKDCSRGAGTWQSSQGLQVADETALCSEFYQHRPRGRGAPPLSGLLLSLYLFLFIWNKEEERGSSTNKDAGETVFQSAGTSLEQGGTLEQL